MNDEAWGWGTSLPYLRALLDYWATAFDWRAAEARLFRYPNFLIDIDGLDLHFLHARSPHAGAMPLVITHGWPGSVFEFLELIPRLTEPEKFGGRAEDAFHVVAPSLPGYGFSAAASAPGMNQRAVARRHVKLMAALGYERYVAQGGDWGAIVSHHTADLDPDHCAGLHMNFVMPVPPAGAGDPMALVLPHEQRYLARAHAFRGDGNGYFQQQRTRPQTLAYGLVDSPAGWCAWVAEKFHAWTDCAGIDGGREIRNAVSWDAMLAHISLYWFTNTIASASRFYKEYGLAEQSGAGQPGRVTVPTGVAQYPFDLAGCPRAWAEALFPLMHWYEAPRGGHFAAMEQPDLFAADLWRFRAALS